MSSKNGFFFRKNLEILLICCYLICRNKKYLRKKSICQQFFSGAVLIRPMPDIWELLRELCAPADAAKCCGLPPFCRPTNSMDAVKVSSTDTTWSGC